MTEAPETAPSDQFRERLLDAMLELAPETGWTMAGMDRGGQGCRADRRPGPAGDPPWRDRPAGSLWRPRGQGGGRAVEGGGRRRPEGPRAKVRAGVKAWLGALDPHKAAVKRAAGTPANLLTGPKGLWAAADAIWSALGDKSTDFNWYTKRTILSGLLGSTLAAWIGSDDEAEVDDFLDRRIENVMQFEKLKGQVKDAFAKMPDPMDLFGQRK
jgi:ubiquinone biosynthesis protein COQ9